MLKLDQRYLSASFVPLFLLNFLFFVGLLIIFKLFRLVPIVVTKGVKSNIIVKLLGDISLSFLPAVVPLAIFFSIIYVFNRFARDSEIVAMRSLGITKMRFLAPFLLLGGLIGGTVFTLGMETIPHAKFRFRNTVIQLTNKGLLTDIRPNQFFTDIPNVILFSENVQAKGTKLTNVFINVSTNSGKGLEEQSIFAKRGHLIRESSEGLDPPVLRLYLTDGSITKTLASGDSVEKTIFKEYYFPLFRNQKLSETLTKIGMKSQEELKKDIQQKQDKLAEYSLKKELFEEDQKHKKELQAHLKKSLLEYWLRMNTPFQCVLFAFWGVGFGLYRDQRRKRPSGFLPLACVIGYYSLFVLSVGLSKKGTLPPFAITFLANTVGIGVATFLFKRS